MELGMPIQGHGYFRAGKGEKCPLDMAIKEFLNPRERVVQIEWWGQSPGCNRWKRKLEQEK